MKSSTVALFIACTAAVLGQGRTITIDVPANQSWTRTGIFVNPGMSVLLEARGSIEAVPASDTRAFFHRVPPEGRPERQDDKPQPLMSALVLLARVGDGPVMEVGAKAEFPGGEPYGSGELQLGINDDHVADNTGSWSVRVTTRGGSSKISQQQGGRGTYRELRNKGNAVAAIESKARQLGTAFLGSAVSDIRITADGVGRMREYQNASIYWSPRTPAHEVHGAIRDKWFSVGAEGGELGYPTSDEQAASDGISRVTHFERGSIFWNQRSGARIEFARR